MGRRRRRRRERRRRRRERRRRRKGGKTPIIYRRCIVGAKRILVCQTLREWNVCVCVREKVCVYV
jgi:hypothetical protein